MKYSYRKKGKYVDGTAKIVIERREKNKKVEMIQLPKPERLWDLLKRLKMVKEGRFG